MFISTNLSLKKKRERSQRIHSSANPLMELGTRREYSTKNTNVLLPINVYNLYFDTEAFIFMVIINT